MDQTLQKALDQLDQASAEEASPELAATDRKRSNVRLARKRFDPASIVKADNAEVRCYCD